MEANFMPIQPITGSITQTGGPSSISRVLPQVEGQEETVGSSFQSMLANALGSVSDTMDGAKQGTEKLLTGQLENLHEASIAGEKAKIMLHLTTQIASKVASSCTTLFQMQL
jgi:flagellar hook-basal body complex protein FliE